MVEETPKRKSNRRISDDKWLKYIKAISQNHSQVAAAEIAGISYSTVQLQLHDPASNLNRLLGETGVKEDAGVFGPDKVKDPNALRALNDFGYFRSRYFARSSSPWAEEAAEKILRLAQSPQKEYVVVNISPGVGKSTFFTHDLPIWLSVRDRARRTMIGSRTANQANKYTGRIRRTLERTTPVKADSDLFGKGLAKDAESTLIADFGRFKPTNSDRWRMDEFYLAQESGDGVEDKEPNFASYGMDSGFLGGRFNMVIWDDLVDHTNTKTEDARLNLINLWEGAMENRLEPNGLLILQGQRMASNDLYRYALDQVEFTEEFEEQPEKAPKIYHHIVYKAHYEELCGKDAKGNPTHKGPYPHGCLLDDYRLPWKEIARLQKNRRDRFELTYQQEDVDSASALIKREWIDGGQDSNGVIHQGCWDKDRVIGNWPKELNAYSVVTADPSPTKYWAVQWWGYSAEEKTQTLIDLFRGPLEAPEFLDWHNASRTFTGLLEEWWQRANDQGHPFTYLIVEANAAQRFLLQYDHFKRWSAQRGVTLIAHQTNRNKSDEEYGVQTLAPHYQAGRVRFPGGGDFLNSRNTMKVMVKELTQWPEGNTDDTVMAHWFLIWNAPHLFDYNQAKPPQFKRPSWMSGRSIR